MDFLPFEIYSAPFPRDKYVCIWEIPRYLTEQELWKISDSIDSKFLNQEPEQSITLLSNGNSVQNGFRIKNLELRLYNDVIIDGSDPHSIITAYLETDEHTIESIYDEDNIGSNSLEISAELLRNNLGLSGIILRLIISLEHKLKNDS